MSSKLIKTIVVTNIFLLSLSLKAQIPFPVDSISLDTLSVNVKSGFDVEDFIRMTKTDTSFYRAFKNLKRFQHTSNSVVSVRDKRGGEKAKLIRTASHYSTGKIGWIQIKEEKTEGKYYKRNGEHKYFTAEMYDKVFFPSDTFECNNTVGKPYEQQEVDSRSREEKYFEQLKTFMFSPGTGVDGVPLIGKKLDIFDGKTRKYYDFNIEKKNFHDSIPCYVFTCRLKDGINPEKVVIKNLTTYYDRRTMNIIARTYQLKQRTAMFDFDIKMYIELEYKNNEYTPIIIRYSGNWDIPFKRPERIDFQMLNSGFVIK